MAEPKPINHQIQVDSVSRETQQEIHAENRNNQFTGSSFKISQQGGVPNDIQQLFVQEIAIDNVTQNSQIQDGKKVVNLSVPKRGASVWKWNNNGNYIWIGGTQATEPIAGDVLLKEEDRDGNGQFEQYWYVFVERDDVVMPVSFGTITQVSLCGAEIPQPDGTVVQSRIDAMIDENGRATLQIDELGFDEMYVNYIYINGIEIRQLIKGIIASGTCGKIGHIDKISQNDITLVNVANKLNEIIDKINEANETN